MFEPAIRRRVVNALLCGSILLLPRMVSAAGEAPVEAWQADVRSDLAAREYWITWQARPVPADLEGAWHAPNRAQGFRTYFTRSGIRVVPRTEPIPSWDWGLSWVGYGRGATSWTPPPATLRPEENRITYRRGALEEFYENNARGLKQGFVLPVPPEALSVEAGAPAAATLRGRDSADLVHVDLALSGNLSPIVSEDGQAVDFVTPAGVRAVRYSELRVTDARNVQLRAWMEGSAEPGLRGIRIVYEGGGAVYPVTIDPLATNPAWTAESNQVDAKFGWSVGTAGDVNGDGYSDVIVGAHDYDNGQVGEGRAFVYQGSAAGLSASPSWNSESDQAGANFGFSVATAGDVNGDGYADVIVGARSYDNVQANEGRAFVYYGSAAGVSASPAWTAEGDQASARFGTAVASAADVNADGYADVIVGAPGYSNGLPGQGRAFIYHGSAAGLSATPTWTAESDQANTAFGSGVSTAGDVNGDGYADIIVGATTYDHGQSDEGRTFVYHGSAVGLSTSPAWTAESDQASALFGSGVSTAGDVNGDGYADVIVGASGYDNGQSDEGRVFAYYGSAAGLSASPSWAVESDQIGAAFGSAVATAGDVNGDGYADVIVGAPFYDGGQSDEGRSFAYAGSAAGLSTHVTWTAESDQAGALFGSAVATAGDVNGDGYADVIAGAYLYSNGQLLEGRAFAFLGSAAGVSTTPGWMVEYDQPDAEFGFSVATAGDVNGDGYADIIVGAHYYDNGEQYEGAAFVYHGSAAGLSMIPAWSAEGNQTNAGFGGSVATAGDVNGDGFADVIVGGTGYNNDQLAEGRAFVFPGSASGLLTSPAWTAESDQPLAFFGSQVASVGDVNGDGYADVIVGASGYNNGEDDEGRTFVYHGSATGLANSPAWTAEGDRENARFSSVASAGDVNGDGYADVIVGARYYDTPLSNAGRAFVYHGSASGLSTSPAWTAQSDKANAYFGTSVASAGDVNGDGYADVVIGAEGYNNGRAFTYHGSAAGLSTAPAWTATGGTHFGTSVASAGDVNGDGYADVIVGAPLYSNSQTFEGRVTVFHGSAAGLSTSPAWTADGNQGNVGIGYAVATAGDVNGDGYADVLVGSRFTLDLLQPGIDSAGRALVYLGNSGPGLSLGPRQLRVSSADPIAHLGASDSPDSFRLALLGRTPFGRGRVKLEWEVKPLGTLFDGVGTTLAEQFDDTGPSGAELSELAADLSSATPYHWRVRLRYDPATTPYAQRSRWLTVPWKGWQETMLRTAALTGAGRAPDGSTGAPLLLDKASGGAIALSWDVSCLATDTDYAIYEGVLGSFTSHTSRFCSTGGLTSKTFTPAAGDAYYLVVPLNAAREGSYGTDSGGGERPQGLDACLPRQIAACP